MNSVLAAFDTNLGPKLLVMGYTVLTGGAVLSWHKRRRFNRAREQLCRDLETVDAPAAAPVSRNRRQRRGTDIEMSIERLVPSLRGTIASLRWTVAHDPLTGLLNRVGFKEAYEVASVNTGVLLFCDVNNFKDINDILGHTVGDRFLVAFADRLKVACSSPFVHRDIAAAVHGMADPPSALVGRLGGDEFIIFLPGIEDEESATRFVQILFRLIEEPCQIGPHSVRASISLGATFTSEHHGAFDRALAAADTAMYQAKEEPGNALAIFNPQMRNRAERMLEREMELRHAIRHSELRLFFQPQVDIASEETCGAEALVRWQHPSEGLLLPDAFIGFAEKYGLIGELGDWVMEKAIETAARWHEQGRQMRISVNVSPAQLASPEFIPHLRACLQCHKLPPHCLEIEFTEQTAMAIDDLLFTRLQSLREQGVTIALDDFGTGYSNLAQLLSAPVDRIKLDRSLLEATENSKNARLVMLTAIRLARQMSVNVVAEGVETERQMQFLRVVKCDVAQGFLFGRPMPEDEFLCGTDLSRNANVRKALQ